MQTIMSRVKRPNYNIGSLRASTSLLNGMKRKNAARPRRGRVRDAGDKSDRGAECCAAREPYLPSATGNVD